MDLNLTNSQTPIVVSSNTTAVNDNNYTVVANATFTDPSPVEGKGFKVFVRNGTAIIGGTSYTIGSQIIRIFHSGAWANYRLDATDKVTANSAITGATKTKVTYDAKGLVTSGADATTADISDSTNKRYVTDAQLTVIGNTSGTNTGDQTLSGLGGVPTTRTINGYDLSANRTLTASDVGAPSGSGTSTGENTGDNFILSGQPFQGNTSTGGTPRYLGFSDNAFSATETARRVFITKSSVLKNFYLRTSGTQPASGSQVFTVLKNGVATSIVVTVPAGSAAGIFSDTTNSETFAQGDEISILAVNNASATSSIIVSYSIGVL